MSHGGLSGKVIQIQFYRTVLTGLIYVVTDSVGRLTSYMTMIITTFLSTVNSMINRSVNVMAWNWKSKAAKSRERTKAALP